MIDAAHRPATDAPPLDPEALRALVKELAGTPSRWRLRVRHGEERHAERLWCDDRVEVWLICWTGEDHDTGFHDHDVSSGALAVVRGELVEERLRLGSPLGRRLRSGESLAFAPAHVHRVRGVGEEPAVSIHAYSPPLRRLGVYAIAPDGALQRRSVEATHELGGDE